MTHKQLRRAARQIAEAALKSVDPGRSLRRCLRVRGHQLIVGHRRYRLTDYDRVMVIGAGKATAIMAREVESLLGRWLSGGMVVVKRRHGCPLERITVREAGHPIPDSDGVNSAQELLHCAKSFTERDLVLCLLSGGASALLPAPAASLTLEDKQRTTSLLLGCGATIGEINAVRKHLSAIKGGQLARAVAPATLITLAISDVIGDHPDIIGSGPTTPDTSMFGEALAVISRYRLESQLPPAVLRHLRNGRSGLIPETPKPGDPLFASSRPPQYEIIANNRLALEAAAAKAKTLGFRPLLLTDALCGEAKEVAPVLVAIGHELHTHRQPVRPPACVITGGETTVTFERPTASAPTVHGGRNQEFALAAALAMAGSEGLLLLAMGTDGSDGISPPGCPDAAGAFADGTTVARGRALGLEPARTLARHDAYPFFDRLGDLLITGPTATNVMDLDILLVVG